MIASLISCGISDGSAPGDTQQLTCSEPEIVANTNSPLGTNLGKVLYFNSSQWLFIDQFNKNSGWLAGTIANRSFTGGSITSYDTNNWPNGLATDTRPHVLLLSGLQGHYPAGTYTIRWEGTGGTLEVEAESNGTNLRCNDGTAIATCASKYGLFDVVTPGNIGINIGIIPDDPTTYTGGNIITNIRVLMPGGVCGRSSTDLDPLEYCQSSTGGVGTCDPGETCFNFDDVDWDRFNDPTSEMHNPKIVFHPQTARQLAKYRSLRFMQSFGIIGSTLSDWNNRPTLTTSSNALSNGIAIEYALELANLLNTDAWLTIPHLADDTYVTNMATLVKDNLNTSLEAYIEYTNEHWNTDPEYTESAYMLSQAVSLSIGVGKTDPERRSMYYATRAAQIFALWTTVFTGQETRISRVLAVGVPYPSATTEMFNIAGIAGNVEGLAIGNYFGGYLAMSDTEAQVQNFSLEDLFHELEFGGLTTDEAATGALSETGYYIDIYKAIADTNSVDLMAYEFGAHLAPIGTTRSNAKILSLMRRANSDARLVNFYQQLFEQWQSKAGTVANHYNHIEPWTFGSFGALEYQDSPIQSSPKYCAILEFIKNYACWWSGC